MKTRKYHPVSIYTLVIMTLTVGCQDVVDETQDEQSATVSQSMTDYRSDYSNTILVGEGFWGDWRQMLYCNPDTWAFGYQMRVEPSLGSRGDDTGLNSVILQCAAHDAIVADYVYSYEGLWGDWHDPAYCSGPDNFLTGARMRIESKRGSGDDTAANDVQFACSGGGIIGAPGATPWGSWGDWVFCPAGTAICGLQIRFENSQGGGDDTAMNGLKVSCCGL